MNIRNRDQENRDRVARALRAIGIDSDFVYYGGITAQGYRAIQKTPDGRRRMDSQGHLVTEFTAWPDVSPAKLKRALDAIRTLRAGRGDGGPE